MNSRNSGVFLTLEINIYFPELINAGVSYHSDISLFLSFELSMCNKTSVNSDYTQSNWSCSKATSERIPMSIDRLCDWGE